MNSDYKKILKKYAKHIVIKCSSYEGQRANCENCVCADNTEREREREMCIRDRIREAHSDKMQFIRGSEGKL